MSTRPPYFTDILVQELEINAKKKNGIQPVPYYLRLGHSAEFFTFTYFHTFLVFPFA